MSIEKLSQAWKTECASHTQKLVLLALSDNASDEGFCWPSIRTLARKCQLSTQSIVEQINHLRDANLIQIIATKPGEFWTLDKGNGAVKISSNRYLVLTGVCNQVAQGVCNGVEQGVQRDCIPPMQPGSTGCATALNRVCNGVEQGVQSGSTESSGKPSATPSENHQIESKRKEEGAPVGATASKTQRFKKPTEEEMKAHALKIGLPEAEAIKCFNYYEANGWRVGRNPMKSWQAAMVNWRMHWEEYKRPSASNGNPTGASDFAPRTIMDFKSVIAAKQTKMDDLKRRFCSEVAMGEEWQNKEAHRQFIELRREVWQINNRISNMA